MKLIRGLINLKHITKRVVAIGNFDGVHIAHQKIIKVLVSKGQSLNATTTIVSFYPHPNYFFGKTVKILSGFKEKYRLLESCGVDELLLINFNHKFANLTANEFIDDILVKQLCVQSLLIGDDFRFGKNRIGDLKLLQQHNIVTQVIDPIYQNNQRVSSSNIRRFLKEGNIKSANLMLGREFSISGKIIRGQQLGRTIGFPTINIALKNRTLPLKGVFTTQVEIDKKRYTGVTNIGLKPTINGKKLTVEMFIFDFSATVYGKYAIILFIIKIRDEKQFLGFEQLKNQIQLDIKLAKDFYTNT